MKESALAKLYKAAASSAAAGASDNAAGEDDKRRMRRSALIKMLIILIFLLLVWLFSTIAWFTMNKDTSGSGMGVRVGAGNFELRFQGDNIGALSYSGSTENSTTTYSSTDLYGKVAETADFAYQLPDGVAQTVSGTEYYDTDGGHAKVILRLNTAYGDPEDELGLSPGTEGEIRFWVIPKNGGTLTVNFSFDICGYTAVQSENVPFDVDSLAAIPDSAPVFTGAGEPTEEQSRLIADVNAQIQAEKYLKTHILFFKGTYNSGDRNWYYNGADAFVNDDMIANGSFPITFTNAIAGNPYEVRVKWVWPNTLKQMIFISGDGEAASVTDNSAAIAEIQQFACDHFSDLLKDVSDRTLMMTHTTTDTFNPTAAAENLETLSRGYNKADSEIGKNVNYMLLILTAE